MSDLAYNINGESFEVPATASGWRVRRMKPRGAPEVVYSKDGIPLVVPIESDLGELRRNVDAPGRFRLDAVDDRGRTIEDVSPAYLMVASTIDDEDELEPRARAPLREDDGAVREAMRLNTELARSVIDRFPEMMHAAAELLRAADGAGLPSRQPRPIDSDDDSDNDDDKDEKDDRDDKDDKDDKDDQETATSSPGFDLLNNLVAQIVPIVMSSIAGKGFPKLAAILDWRKAAESKQEPEMQKAVKSDKVEKVIPSNESAALDPKMMAHVIAIQSALTPAEAALARQLAAELSPAETRAWFDELAEMSVPDAVAKIRSIVGKAGGKS